MEPAGQMLSHRLPPDHIISSESGAHAPGTESGMQMHLALRQRGAALGEETLFPAARAQGDPPHLDRFVNAHRDHECDWLALMSLCSSWLALIGWATRAANTLRLVAVPTVHSRGMGCGCMVRVRVNED